ncbi:MAG: glycoside hydrolase family 127 protein, partial [Anaerolineaceae bacterium]|nr:glycoside hydrolase family 127 protein [Anaerolineaceae bacterium]
AVSMYALRYGEYSLWPALRESWVRMIEKRMFVTGGTGSLPISEAFGRDYELDPSTAYAETCAALGTMFWNWEMTQLFNEASYADLFERQLYNAALVGIGLSGNCYLYNNPLENKDGLKRQPWFEIPCCPSNLSRTLAALGQYIFTYEKNTISIHQYIGSKTEFALDKSISIEVESNFPWNGKVKIHVSPESAYYFELIMRVPSWCGKPTAHLNGIKYPLIVPAAQNLPPTASGYDPRYAQNVALHREWSPGDILELDFSMPIEIQKPHPKVRSCAGRYAITRGPIVYCLEGKDNPGIDIFNCVVDPHSLIAEFDSALLGGITKITGKTKTGQALVFIPYAWWANRDPGPMTVYVKM